MRAELLRERYEPLEVVGRGRRGRGAPGARSAPRPAGGAEGRPVADEASRAHLLSEARLLLSLTPHPGLPLVREDFFEEDRYVIAMDWIEGTDLEALLGESDSPGLDPALCNRLPRRSRRGARASARPRATRRARRRQAGEPDPDVVRPDRPRRLRAVLYANRRTTSGGHGRLHGARGCGGSETDLGLGRVFARRHRPGAADRRTARAGVHRTGARSSPSGSRPWSGSCARNLATDSERRDPSASAFVDAAEALVGRRAPEWNRHARGGRRARRVRTERENVP